MISKNQYNLVQKHLVGIMGQETQLNETRKVLEMYYINKENK